MVYSSKAGILTLIEKASMLMTRLSLCLLLSLLYSTVPLFTQADVYSWRNGGDGAFPDAKPPLDWETAESTVWTASFAGSNASPILVKRKLFFTEEPTTLVCVTAKSGKLLWKRDNDLLNLMGLNEKEIEKAKATVTESERIKKAIAEKRYQSRRLGRSESSASGEAKERRKKLGAEIKNLEQEREKLRQNDPYGSAVLPVTHPTNGYCSYTPVSDGKTIFTCFGSGTVVAYNLKGRRLWHKLLGDADHDWGGSVSPLLIDGKLIVKFSDYVALNPRNGEEIWRTPSRVNFGTPISFKLEDQTFLFTSRGEVIRLSDGRKLTDELIVIDNEDRYWTVFNSPVLLKDRLYTVRGVKGDDGHAYQFRIPETVRALEEQGLELIWRKDIRKQRYYASPLLVDELFYVLSDNHWLTVLEADSGELVYEHKIEDMGGVAYPSLVRAGDFIFAGSENGQVAFFKPGRNYVEVARGKVPEYRSTPVFVGDRAYIRTLEDIRAIQ